MGQDATLEIRIHGRSGQGNVVAAYLLATAAIEEGRSAQAFPAFGAERRGAPVVAFVRISERPIRQRSQVRAPAFLIIQAPALLHVPGVTAGLLPGGAILVNAERDSEALSAQVDHPTATLPANGLAMKHLGRPVPNTALLAAFLTLTGVLPLESLSKALASRFRGEVLERNVRLIQEAARQVPAGQWQEVGHAASA
jgi:pyruvate ferredoxin oxidoreductase gamma subunit